MRLLLCSDFKNVGYKYLSKFLDLSQKHKCLFIDYASEDFEGDADYTSSSMEKIRSLNFDIIALKNGYDFNDNIDMIYVRGGNTTKLVHLLREFDQFEKIKAMVSGGTLFVGESAGAVLAGSDTEWTLASEPYDFDVKKKFGDNALKGFGFVDKMIFVHCSKYRFPYSGECEAGTIIRLPNTEYYRAYLNDKKVHKKGTFITLGNNQVYYQNGEISRILTYDWSKIPVKKLN